MSENSATPDDQVNEQPFVSHLFELRDRLLRVVLAILVLFLGLFPFANDIYVIVAGPLLESLPTGSTMIVTGPIDAFFTPMKLTLVLSIYIVMPFILFQVWGFIAPGLYTHERQLVFPLMASSSLLFYAGMAFAYFVVFPIMFPFLVGYTPEGAQMMPDIGRYLEIVLKLFFAFGLAFEVPVATILLVTTGMTTPESLTEKRPYVIVFAFIFGMLLTPPDIFSQTLLAIPMWILFEVGVWYSRILVKRKRKREIDEGLIDPEAESDVDESGEARFTPMSDEEMDEELDRIEAEEAFYDDDEEETPKKS